MGCCLSSTPTDKSSAPNPHPHFQRSDDSRAPPPVDEETVKEVLSETPKPKLQQDQPVFQVPQQQPMFQEKQEHKTTQEPVFEVKLDQIQEQHKKVFVDQEPTEKWDKRIPICAEISEEVSEICSLQSESVSATTATRDDDEEVQQRVVVNSSSSNRVSPRKLQKSPQDGFGPGRVVGKSPTRRTDSSPGRRYGNGVGSGRLGQPGQQPVGGRRVGLRGEPNRRDPGESSGRRSRSPATRITDNNGVSRANVSRSPSANRRCPGRSPVGPVESSNSSTRRRAEEPRMEEGKWAANESLENPLVSLECFIFL